MRHDLGDVYDDRCGVNRKRIPWSSLTGKQKDGKGRKAEAPMPFCCGNSWFEGTGLDYE